MNKHEKNIPYRLFNDFVFRSPLMPISFVDDVFQNGMYQVMDAHKSIIDQAIFLASPNLYRKLEQRRTGRLKENQLEFDLSILKYLTRMASRCTPFGIFAGIGTGKFNEECEIICSEPMSHKTHTKLSQDYLYDYYATLCTDPEIEKSSTYFTNNTLYRKGDRLRYTEYVDQDNHRTYTLSSVDANEILLKICAKCLNGASWKEMISLITQQGVSEDEATTYLRILIRNCVLINGLEPTPVSEDMLSDLIQKLCTNTGRSKHYQFCRQIKDDLLEIDERGLGSGVTNYRQISRKLKAALPDKQVAKLFHVDMGLKVTQASLSEALVEEMANGLMVLNRLTARNHHQFLTQFRQEFFRRYENEEIPLIEALDSESGILLENRDSRDMNFLIADIPVGSGRSSDFINVNPQQKFQIEEYFNYLEHQGINSSHKPLFLRQERLHHLPLTWDDVPGTFAVMSELSRTSQNEFLIYLKTATGVNASKTLSRFHQVSSELKELISQIAEHEKKLYDKAIVAEILHLPQTRVGNVLLRPQVYDYQIPIVTRSHKKAAFQIPVSDLMISVRNGQRIVLRSTRLKKQIIPRLSTAHNFSYNSIPIYRFLCYLQMQDLRPDLTFQWADLLSGRPFLPRVQYGNVILSTATWNLEARDIPSNLDIRSGKFHHHIRDFQENHKLPDRVMLARGDRKLLVDFRQLLSCQMFYSELKGKPFVLNEFFMDSGESLIRDQRGQPFSGEYVFCYYQNQN